MNKIEFSKDAKNDLVDIYRYIKYNLQEPNIANKLIDTIEKEIYKLQESPTIYSIIDDDFIRNLEIRKFKINNYIVFYRFNKDRSIVEIIRIMYARRNWIALLT